MTMDELKQIRLSGKRPESIINLSLCRDSLLLEPVIEFSSQINFEDIDFRPLHKLDVDIHYWKRKDDAFRLVEIISKIEPRTVHTVNQKNLLCTLVYFKGEACSDDLTFLYDCRHRAYA
jgi:hypothetical protein